ncbi:MAG: beta-ketoacyl-ACP synthase III [Peptococcaceae bacterium]|nr:ketoacyl-ACP synthase III [Peptococcaceae bacterium]MDH7525469.1 beta-ketoacyl-ACP synthase III [Peptococcaceae bacterium]
MSAFLRPAGITGIGTYLPSQKITNADLEKMVDTSDEWIRTRTGISERRKADPAEAASDLGTKAALKALEDAGVTPEEIEMIIVSTANPDMLFPATACLIQDNLGAKNSGAFDLFAACTGFIYALAVANQFVASGMYNTVLVVATEILTRLVNWEDRNTCVLFGDGAGAAVVRPVGEGEGFLSFDLHAEGAGGDLLKVPAGGSRMPASLDTVANKMHYIHMAGNEVFKFAVRIMGETALKALEKAGLSKEDVDFLIPHQANTRIIDSAVKRLGLSPDKVYINLDKYGNMSSASIPVALEEALEKGLIKKGDCLVLVGFGAGLTYGACVLKWCK